MQFCMRFWSTGDSNSDQTLQDTSAKHISIALQIFLPQLFCLVSHTKWQLSQSLLPPPRFAEFNDGIGPRRLSHLALQIDSRHRFISQRSSTGTTQNHNTVNKSGLHRSSQKQKENGRESMRPNRRCPLCPWRGVLWRSFSHFAILKEGAATFLTFVWNSMVECKPKVRALNAWDKFSSISPVPVSLSPETVEGFVSTSALFQFQNKINLSPIILKSGKWRKP